MHVTLIDEVLKDAFSVLEVRQLVFSIHLQLSAAHLWPVVSTRFEDERCDTELVVPHRLDDVLCPLSQLVNLRLLAH